MKHKISLDYTIAEGDLKPYFDALGRSEALASRCEGCGRVSFPLRIICGACGSHLVARLALTGLAKLVHRTDGATRSFALMKFAGADTLSTVALLNPTSQATTGRLRSPADGRPGLWVELNEITEGDVNV
tara:strand:- start:22447 stop:22836 length:390 start_codon:yes stop_codon:yes gene_type:complete